MRPVDVLVVGGGVAAMSAAALAARSGLRVRLLEANSRLGGKAGSIFVDGAELDTGPSVLTLPHVLHELFDQVELPVEERFELVELNPGFRYLFPGGGALLVYHDLERTLASVEVTLGSRARDELRAYLNYTRQIWEAAAPHFVFNQAPSVGRLLTGGLATIGAALKIDPWRTLSKAIGSFVKTPELVALLKRYATYCGSDARSAPATLGCIAHVELELGGFGVRGGMRRVVDALERCLTRSGVEVVLAERVSELQFAGDRVNGARTANGVHEAHAVIVGADPWQWLPQFPKKSQMGTPFVRSMSAYNAIFHSSATHPELAPHTVIFPTDYDQEFANIFDDQIVPQDPTVYVCAQDRCHLTRSFPSGEPLFTMVNAPAIPESSRHSAADSEHVRELVRSRLSKLNILERQDRCLWERNPAHLADEFPGSSGALYGPASNTMGSAFQRLPNQLKDFPGLFVASGAAHPGGGVPLAVQSGKLAARLVLETLKRTS
jgi:1-hydroxycarotenoid 3,4-desaturase